MPNLTPKSEILEDSATKLARIEYFDGNIVTSVASGILSYKVNCFSLFLLRFSARRPNGI